LQSIRYATEMDSVFANIVWDCENRMVNLDRHLRIRVAQWITKLGMVLTDRPHWKRLRNAYAKYVPVEK